MVPSFSRRTISSPPPKDLYLLALQSKLLRQSDRLTVSGTKNPRSAHAPTSSNVYTAGIHAVPLDGNGLGWNPLLSPSPGA